MNYIRPWVRDEDDLTSTTGTIRNIAREAWGMRGSASKVKEQLVADGPGQSDILMTMLQRVELIGDALCTFWARQRWNDVEIEIDIRFGGEMSELEELWGECPVALGYWCWATFRSKCREQFTNHLLRGVRGYHPNAPCLDGMVDRVDKVVAPPPKGHKLRPVWDKWVRVRKTRKTKKQG